MQHKSIRFLWFIVMLAFTIPVQGQLNITPGGVPAQLVQNVLVGTGVTISNVTYTGSLSAIGSFTTGANQTNLGFSSGIILASGNVTTATGPNNSGSAGTSLGTPGDQLLNSLISGTTYDAAVLEFDFVPLSDTIKFRYVFGSEEYPEYVNSSFNDVFGFFVSGGYDPVTWTPFNNRNIAIIPGTVSTPVSINNVNNGSTNAGPCNNCAYYINNTGGLWVQYDGLTTVLTAWLRVVPCITYHLKIAIADAGDGILDSGVFLEANSFVSDNVQLSSYTTTPSIDTMAIEGCNSAVIKFKLPSPTSIDRTVYYSVGGSATNGVDYTQIPTSITIPAGSDSALLYINPLFDTITEGIETVRIIANTSPCTTDTIYVYIKDYHHLDPTTSNDTILCATPSTLWIHDTLGIPPYSYNWSTGDTTSTINIFPTTTTLYKVTLTDNCQMTYEDSIYVSVSKPVITTVDDTVCVGDPGTVSAAAVGATQYSWNTGETTPTVTKSPNVTTTYTVVVSDTLGCKDTADATIWVNNLPVVSVTNDTTICFNDSITLTGDGGVSYVWSTGDNQQSITVSPPQTRSYTVTVTDHNNCSNDATMNLDVIELPTTQISALSDTICRGASIMLNVFGATNYLWSTGSVLSAINVSPIESISYWVLGENNQNGISCYASDTFRLGVKRCNRFYVPNAFTPDGDGLNDDFGPEGVFEGLEKYEVYIFDRYGKLVFMSTDPRNRWDGRLPNGKYGPDGVYAYKMIIKEAYSDEYQLSGTVTVIR